MCAWERENNVAIPFGNIGQVAEMKEVMRRLQAKSLIKLKREEDLVELGHKGREGINVE